MSTYSPRLKTTYKEKVVPALRKEFNYKSSMQVPRLMKIAVNQGLGNAVGDKKIVENAIGEMTMITGQKAVGTAFWPAIAVISTMAFSTIFLSPTALPNPWFRLILVILGTCMALV